ncbi:cytochrome P450 [Micromonospora endolithica]|uniref:Cytochrome P450 n=1 Tax=Micromonospora endolithica TaxID=230091 RepID=A0A3A9Z772_9ACTN|nr:cytochrome P450 [Micromonospora endolithica]
MDVHLAFEEDRMGYLRDLAERYGDVVRVGERAWLVNDPGAARHVLQTTGTEFTTVSDFLGRSVPARRYDSHHQAAINGVHALLARWATAPRLSRIQEHVRRLLPAGEGILDPLPLGRRIGVALATEACLGQPDPKVEQDSVRLLDTLLPKLSSPWLLPGWVPTPRNLRLARRDATLTRRFTKVPTAPDAWGQDTIRTLLRRRSPAELGFSTATDTWIKKLLLASQEPTGAAPAWALHRMLTAPEWLARVESEVADVDPLGAELTDPLRQLPVTSAVVFESLRLHPPTWLISRRVLVETDLCGFPASPGQIIYLSPWLLHQNAEAYPDPLAFRPDRWLDPQQRKRSQQGYFAFSRGPHSCPGRLPSLALTVCLVGALVRRYELTSDGGQVGTDARRSMLPVGVRLRIRPRPATPPADQTAGTRRSRGDR